MPTANACSACGVVQAKAWVGPKLRAVDSVVVAAPSTAPPTTSSAAASPASRS